MAYSHHLDLTAPTRLSQDLCQQIVCLGTGTGRPSITATRPALKARFKLSSTKRTCQTWTDEQSGLQMLCSIFYEKNRSGRLFLWFIFANKTLNHDLVQIVALPVDHFLVLTFDWSVTIAIHPWLGGGFKHVLFSPLPGEMIRPIWLFFFKMGWNHQPDEVLAHWLPQRLSFGLSPLIVKNISDLSVRCGAC